MDNWHLAVASIIMGAVGLVWFYIVGVPPEQGDNAILPGEKQHRHKKST